MFTMTGFLKSDDVNQFLLTVDMFFHSPFSKMKKLSFVSFSYSNEFGLGKAGSSSNSLLIAKSHPSGKDGIMNLANLYMSEKTSMSISPL